MSITYLYTGTPFMTVVPDAQDADVSVPAYAHSLSEACATVRDAYAFNDLKVTSIETLPMSRSLTLLAVYCDDAEVPALLLYHGEIGTTQADLDAMSVALMRSFVQTHAQHLIEGDDATSEASLRATVKRVMNRINEAVAA